MLPDESAIGRIDLSQTTITGIFTDVCAGASNVQIGAIPGARRDRISATCTKAGYADTPDGSMTDSITVKRVILSILIRNAHQALRDTSDLCAE